MGLFAGQKVLITGGSSGIGFALAEELLAAGAHVCIAARNPERLARAEERLRAIAAGRVVSVRMDIRDRNSVAAGAKAALEKLGDLDILVNNAGYALPRYIDELDEQAFTEMTETNYLGPVRLIRALLPHFVSRRVGTIVNVTSMLGFMGTFGYAAYAGSKYALSGYTECLRQDLLPYGIRVALCYPPTTDTPGLSTENQRKPAETWAIERTSRAFSPSAVAKAIVRGIRRRRFHILVGFDSRLIWILSRYWPGLVRWTLDRVLWKYIRQHGHGRKPSLAAPEAPLR
jgi:3-dehydrosphinganine reductase